jgi:hypothetical protein
MPDATGSQIWASTSLAKSAELGRWRGRPHNARVDACFGTESVQNGRVGPPLGSEGPTVRKRTAGNVNADGIPTIFHPRRSLGRTALQDIGGRFLEDFNDQLGRFFDPENDQFPRAWEALSTTNYDDFLRDAGPNTTQFSLLCLMRRRGTVGRWAVTWSWIAPASALLLPLERDDLIHIRPGTDKGIPIASVTGKGRRLVEDAEPKWRKTQEVLIETIGEDQWFAMRLLLRDTTRMVRIAGKRRSLQAERGGLPVGRAVRCEISRAGTDDMADGAELPCHQVAGRQLADAHLKQTVCRGGGIY